MFQMDYLNAQSPQQAEEVNFTLQDKDGNPIACTLLFTLYDPKTALHYLVYTNHTTDESGNIRVLANIYDPDDREAPLLPIQDDAVWDEIERFLKTYA